MQTYQIRNTQGKEGLERLTLVETETGALAHQEVRVAIKATSLNYRDLGVAQTSHLEGPDAFITPCSDGAGEVIAVGSDVSRFKIGDRVMASFFPNWVEGRVSPEKTASALGGAEQGMLSETVTLPEHAWVAIPDNLSFAEAATLPCAGLTAWNALFVAGALKPGDSVLLLGTGGVSTLALQLAKAAGIRTIITSSSDAKLAQARELGADEAINYRTTPEWQDEVLRCTQGRGVDLVLEVGGVDTLERSIAATAMGGTVAIIGGVSGFGGSLPPFALIGGAKRLAGILVGNRTMLEDLGRFVETARIHPTVGREFPFEQAHEAFGYLADQQHLGKVVVLGKS